MMPRSQTLPRFIGPFIRLPALSLLLGHSPAHETRCPAVGNRLMSVPILGQDSGCGNGSDTRDRLQQLERLFERRQAALNLYLHLSNGLLQEIDVRQEL